MLHTAMEMKHDNQCCKYIHMIYIYSNIYVYVDNSYNSTESKS